MLIVFLWLLTRALKPLRDVAKQLRQRKPDELSPVMVPTIPSEAKPILDSLNGLFDKINHMFVRERQFTSDAAHELRSPLAALKVQTEVVQIAGSDEAIRQHAVANLSEGIDRATRLVDQLLTLSRLESSNQLDDVSEVSWQELIEQAVRESELEARQNQVTLKISIVETPPPFKGQKLLLSVLLRNLLHNAIRYGKAAGKVEVNLYRHHLEVKDDGDGVSSEVLARLGERFYRPPGQEKTGSGLGLSIVKRVAQLHHLHVTFNNVTEGGFCVTVRWSA
jgi:two-component system sensor histidine kinase QseC